MHRYCCHAAHNFLEYTIISVDAPKFSLIGKEHNVPNRCNRRLLYAIISKVRAPISLIYRQYPECVA